MSIKKFLAVRETQTVGGKEWPEATLVIVWDTANNNAYEYWADTPEKTHAAIVSLSGDELTIITNLDGKARLAGGGVKESRCITIAKKAVLPNGQICYRGMQDGVWRFTIYNKQ